MNDFPGAEILDVPDWTWQAVSGELVARGQPPVRVELTYGASEAVCRYSEAGEVSREESFVGGTLRVLDFRARRAVIRAGEPTERAMRQVTEPFLGPARAVREGRYAPRRSLDGRITFRNSHLVLSVIELRPDGLPLRVRLPEAQIAWRSITRTRAAAPPSATAPPEDWAVERYSRLDGSAFLGDDALAVAELDVYEVFEYQSPSMPAPYRTAIWKDGPREVKLVTGTVPGAGPRGVIRDARAVRTRTPDGFAYLHVSSPDLLDAAIEALDGVAGFDAAHHGGA